MGNIDKHDKTEFWAPDCPFGPIITDQLDFAKLSSEYGRFGTLTILLIAEFLISHPISSLVVRRSDDEAFQLTNDDWKGKSFDVIVWMDHRAVQEAEDINRLAIIVIEDH